MDSIATDRNIPAYAGKTARQSAICFSQPEHPRIRGENFCPCTEVGKERRNIPAYAGKTPPFSNHSMQAAEHPRIRGENRRRTASFSPPYGTSPHTRGKPVPTPPNRQCASGTSPHTRGKRRFMVDRLRGRRNIPAYAGKTWCRGGGKIVDKEHPRIRGENLQRRYHHDSNEGTSPHTRGKPAGAGSACSWMRNIPAYAGKTNDRHVQILSKKEHPRIRGENRFRFW